MDPHMVGGDLEGTFQEAQASVEAAAARLDEEAAADLARSLLQDVDMSEALQRWGAGAIRLEGGSSVPIEVLGTDFVAGAGGSVIVPLARLVAVEQDGVPFQTVEEAMVQRLRAERYPGAKAQVTTPSGTIEGTLERVGGDHLELQGMGGRVIVALDAVRLVRFVRAG
jgi:hypothetical protein